MIAWQPGVAVLALPELRGAHVAVIVSGGNASARDLALLGEPMVGASAALGDGEPVAAGSA